MAELCTSAPPPRYTEGTWSRIRKLTDAERRHTPVALPRHARSPSEPTRRANLFAAVALFLCTSSLFTAVLCYALGRRLGLPPPGAALAALAFTLGAGRLMNAARLNLFGTEFLLLWLYAGVLLWQRPGGRRALGFGICGGILLWQSQPLFYQGTLAVTFGAAAAVVRAARCGEPRAVRRRVVGFV